MPKIFKTDPKCSVTGNNWYECPVPITIFTLFLFTFIYSIVVLINTSSMITDKEFSEEKYGKTLYDIFLIYIVNLVVTFLSLIVILYYIYKIIPEDYVQGLFNDIVGIVFALYIIIVSSWTINVYQKIQNHSKGVLFGFAGTALGLSLLILILYVYQIYSNFQDNAKGGRGVNKPKKPQEQSGIQLAKL